MPTETNRELAEALEAARASDQRLHSIVDSAMDAIITVDKKQRITLFNRAAERIFGYESREVLGEPLETLMPERFRRSHHAHIDHFGQTGVSSRPMGHQRIVAAIRRNGEEFPIDASISQVQVGNERYYTVILRDVSRRVTAERDLAQVREDLRELAVASRTAREQENSRISRELHDELGQNLTSLKMDIAYLEQKLDATLDPDVKNTLGEMRKLLDTTMAAARRISADLRPLLLDDLGLVPAIEWLVSNFSQRSGVATELAADEALELREPYATAVFRIVQESLANVAKHAGASQAFVSVAKDADGVKLVVRDNGRGFDARAPRKPHSLGLMGLRERAQLLRGSFTLKSSPGEGTEVQVRIPITKGGA